MLWYLVATVLIGAAIAPLLFWAGQYVTGVGRFQSWHNVDFHRYFDRGVLIAAIALVYPLSKALRIRNTGDLALIPDQRRWTHLAVGLFFALVSVGLLIVSALYLKAYRLRLPANWWPLLLLLPTAATVACIEETLFRGVIQGAVQRSASKFLSLVFVAALFAIIHFLKPPQNAIALDSVGWSSGFALIPRVFWQFEHPDIVLGGFTTLFLVGLILGYARLQTQSLWMPIGLHAGWIIGKMGFTKISKHGPASVWFGPDLLVGLCPVAVLLLTAIVVWWWLNYRNA